MSDIVVEITQNTPIVVEVLEAPVDVDITPAGPVTVAIDSPQTIVVEVIEAAPITIELGEFGPTGPPGSVIHVFQQPTPNATWTIPHGLGRLPLAPTIFGSDGQLRLAPVANPDPNTMVVSFGTPQTGSVVYA